MDKTEIINSLIEKYNYKTYVEIGVQHGKSFNGVNVEEKIGVDPHHEATFQMSSDDFFAGISEGKKYDIFLIDGLHHSEQVHKDIINALDHLNKGGTIVCHDMNPTSEAMQQVPRTQRVWTGDCWKAWVKIRQDNGNLSMYVVDTDYGCGIIRKGRQKKLVVNEELTYENLDKNRVEWLKLITVDEFREKL